MDEEPQTTVPHPFKLLYREQLDSPSQHSLHAGQNPLVRSFNIHIQN